MSWSCECSYLDLLLYVVRLEKKVFISFLVFYFKIMLFSSFYYFFN